VQDRIGRASMAYRLTRQKECVVKLIWGNGGVLSTEQKGRNRYSDKRGVESSFKMIGSGAAKQKDHRPDVMHIFLTVKSITVRKINAIQEGAYASITAVRILLLTYLSSFIYPYMQYIFITYKYQYANEAKSGEGATRYEV